VEATAFTTPVVRPAQVKSYTEQQAKDMAGLTPTKLSYVSHVTSTGGTTGEQEVEFENESDRIPVVQVGVKTTYRFKVYADAASYRVCTFSVRTFPDSKVYTMKTLPKEVRALFLSAALAREREGQAPPDPPQP
jgi:hypothetical protein